MLGRMRGRAGVVGSVLMCSVLMCSVLMCSVLLAGCGADDEPALARPSMVRPTAVRPTDAPASATGTTTAKQVVPKAARAHTYAGADAFARFYFAQVNKAWMTPDGSAIEGLSTTRCATCTAFEAKAKALESAQRKYGEAPVRVLASGWLPDSTRARPVLDVVVRQEPARVLDAAGVVVSRDKRRRGTFRCNLLWDSGAWRVDKIQEVVFK